MSSTVEGYRFVFKDGHGTRFGLTQDMSVVENAKADGLQVRDYEREPGVWEWEVNLGKEPDDASGELRT